jgi:DNA-binding GntR family transcriptional regulator
MSKTGLGPIAQEKDSLVDRVTDAIRHSIIVGRLRPAEPLSISDLASDLGVSHSPVREALQRLASQGLVELRPARSAIVAPLCVDDLEDIYRVRKMLESDTAARACPRLVAEDIAVLERELELLGAHPVDSEEFWTHHDRFHTALMQPALSPRLERLIQQHWHAAERYIRVAYADSDVFRDRSPEERHRPLLKAAKSGKESVMRKALLEHLEMNEREITEQLRETLAR